MFDKQGRFVHIDCMKIFICALVLASSVSLFADPPIAPMSWGWMPVNPKDHGPRRMPQSMIVTARDDYNTASMKLNWQQRSGWITPQQNLAFHASLQHAATK
jgi:hypothetical protein